MFSGNLDARAIRDILERWGIYKDFHMQGEEKLLVVKNHRNTLAHGDRSFKEIGRDYTISDLKEYTTYCYNYLIELVKQFYVYIEDERFIDNK
ncbi:MAE_28990/MAE_18760 family HEPN-like nuclease [uncultured Anaerovibrio sp.]|uniref:MAE_28990/MAE_18760 family HEPN-like nuclease n=1 Tax=uncultured Anaerovibrio sp. TaxID=361586 RepID=UPI0026230925|nr:MAE_28990/MAE_18760 family HEPN-like nuclease [uncultured Anaerovibrio sp.]